MIYNDDQIRQAVEKVASLAAIKGMGKMTVKHTKNLIKGKSTLPEYGRRMKGIGKGVGRTAVKDAKRAKKWYDEL